MDSHIVGKDFSPTPNPSPNAGRAPEFGEGNSLAVVQFVELMRGERTRQAPVRRGVVELRCEEAYCLGCCDVRVHDVGRDAGRQVVVQICRCCGEGCGA